MFYVNSKNFFSEYTGKISKIILLKNGELN
jgi:hypothetical protein